ncbi:hypothetical protein ACROYT_G030072 [Oculina patagonica]
MPEDWKCGDLEKLPKKRESVQTGEASRYYQFLATFLVELTSKTKSWGVNQGNNSNLNIGGDEIQDIENFTYLGSIVSSEGGTDQDILARIGKATTAFHILRPIWRPRAISVKTKLRIFNTNVTSVPLYACETWRVTRASNRQPLSPAYPPSSMAGQSQE